jgi:hypothetical protein
MLPANDIAKARKFGIVAKISSRMDCAIPAAGLARGVVAVLCRSVGGPLINLLEQIRKPFGDFLLNNVVVDGNKPLSNTLLDREVDGIPDDLRPWLSEIWRCDAVIRLYSNTIAG